MKPPAGGPSRRDAAGAAERADTPEFDEDIHRAYQASAEAVRSAYLDAQRQYLVAYWSCLESVQQITKGNHDPVLAYLGDVARARGDAQATAEANRKFVLAHAEQQVSGQKALIEAATAYSKSLREIYAKLEDEVSRHNQALAEALKDALLKMDVRMGDVPSLAFLYESLRRMSARSSSPTTSA